MYMYVVNNYNEDAQKRRERQHNDRELSTRGTTERGCKDIQTKIQKQLRVWIAIHVNEEGES